MLRRPSVVLAITGNSATMVAQITYDMMVAMKLVDPAKVDLKKTYTTQFIKDIKVLP